MFCLTQSTPSTWVEVALRDLDAVLADHAHCEIKAATTALSLALKNHRSLDVVLILSQLAQEEIDHFMRVVGFLQQRGVALGVPPVDGYAARLRKSIQELGPTTLDPIVDRLLVGALIEARSCERFMLLIEAWPEHSSSELRDFYRELFECEAKHYVQYRELALRISAKPAAVVFERLNELAAVEGRIVAELGEHMPSPSVHG